MRECSGGEQTTAIQLELDGGKYEGEGLKIEKSVLPAVKAGRLRPGGGYPAASRTGRGRSRSARGGGGGGGREREEGGVGGVEREGEGQGGD